MELTKKVVDCGLDDVAEKLHIAVSQLNDKIVGEKWNDYTSKYNLLAEIMEEKDIDIDLLDSLIKSLKNLI